MEIKLWVKIMTKTTLFQQTETEIASVQITVYDSWMLS